MERPTDQESIDTLWHMLLTEGHTSKWAFLPGADRCFVCHVPMSGVGGRLLSLKGYHPSPHNPRMCNFCEDFLPPGGAEIDIAVFAFTALGDTVNTTSHIQARAAAAVATV